MAEIELADQQVAEQPDIGVQPADIPAPDKPQTVREAINSSIKEIEQKDQRARDEASGKFVKESKSSPAESPQGKVETAAPLSDQPISKPAGPPPGWSPASKEFFNNLPPDHPIRQDVAKREDEVSKGFKDYSEKTKRYDELERVLAPSRAVYQQFGAKSDAEAVSRLIEWESALRSDPRGGIQRLAQQLGVDLSQLARPDSSDGAPDPLRPVMDQFGQLSQSVHSVQSQIQAWQQEQVGKDLAAFAKDKPHFERVRMTMGQLMQSGIVRPDDLEGAYQKAVSLDSELSEQISREREEKKAAELAKTQAEQAKNARLAAVSPAPKARQGPIPAQDKSQKGVRASLLASISELRDRA